MKQQGAFGKLLLYEDDQGGGEGGRVEGDEAEEISTGQMRKGLGRGRELWPGSLNLMLQVTGKH